MFSMESADLSTEFHRRAVEFVTESFSAVQLSGIPLIEVSKELIFDFFSNVLEDIEYL